MSKVSIIIPVYNVEKFLKQCLDSVINQTLQDVEIICIDDCSTDNSLQILKEYASKDNRIRIIEQKINQGQGVARNEAIKIATGEYIGFVDPDDWIELDMYEKMYNKAKTHDTDIVICNIEKVFEKTKKKRIVYTLKDIRKFDKTIETDNVYNFKNLLKYYPYNTQYYTCCRIFKNNLIKNNNILFSNTKRTEDVIFNDMANFLAKKIIHIDKAFYHYRNHREIQYIKNPSLIKICLEYLIKFYKFKNLKDLMYGIKTKITILCFKEYRNLNNKKEKETFYLECKNFLPFNVFINFRNQVIKYQFKNFVKNILSTKNIKKNGVIYKYLYILGLKIKLMRKENNE